MYKGEPQRVSARGSWEGGEGCRGSLGQRGEEDEGLCWLEEGPATADTLPPLPLSSPAAEAASRQRAKPKSAILSTKRPAAPSPPSPSSSSRGCGDAADDDKEALSLPLLLLLFLLCSNRLCGFRSRCTQLRDHRCLRPLASCLRRTFASASPSLPRGLDRSSAARSPPSQNSDTRKVLPGSLSSITSMRLKTCSLAEHALSVAASLRSAERSFGDSASVLGTSFTAATTRRPVGSSPATSEARQTTANDPWPIFSSSLHFWATILWGMRWEAGGGGGGGGGGAGAGGSGGGVVVEGRESGSSSAAAAASEQTLFSPAALSSATSALLLLAGGIAPSAPAISLFCETQTPPRGSERARSSCRGPRERNSRG